MLDLALQLGEGPPGQGGAGRWRKEASVSGSAREGAWGQRVTLQPCRTLSPDLFWRRSQ